VPCAAFTRPEAFLQGLGEQPADQPADKFEGPAIPDRDQWEREAKLGVEHRRLPRVAGAGRAASGRAACRACKEPIPKDAWRIALSFYDEGRFAPSGFIHLSCARAYFETTDVMSRIRHFEPELSEADLGEIEKDLPQSP
jgi:hypothetical protein